jgi:hypothetical protein
MSVLLGIEPSKQVDKNGYETGPARLMAGADAGAVVPVDRDGSATMKEGRLPSRPSFISSFYRGPVSDHGLALELLELLLGDRA